MVPGVKCPLIYGSNKIESVFFGQALVLLLNILASHSCTVGKAMQLFFAYSAVHNAIFRRRSEERRINIICWWKILSGQ